MLPKRRPDGKLRLDAGLFDDEIDTFIQDGKTDLSVALALQRMEFLRCREKLILSRRFASLRDMAAAASSDVAKCIGRALPAGVWKPAEFRELALRDMEFLESRSVSFATVADPRYPPLLRFVYKPPFGLYARGGEAAGGEGNVAVVGTRMPTGQGLHSAFAISESLSRTGVRVVSGLARGVDSAAHRGAIRGRAKTTAVMACGIERIYPASNRALAASILDGGGTIVTEYPPFSEVRNYHFPERNRIISGMCSACVVVEAPEGSGALITADHALSEGRDVFVHESCMGSSRNEGGIALARQGAGIVNDAGDIVPAPVIEREGAGSDASPRVGERERYA